MHYRSLLALAALVAIAPAQRHAEPTLHVSGRLLDEDGKPITQTRYTRGVIGGLLTSDAQRRSAHRLAAAAAAAA